MKKNKTNQWVNGIIKTCVWILLILLVIYLGMRGYKFGQKIFSEEGYDLSPGVDVTITIQSGDSNMDVAKKLEKHGVIGDHRVFFAQCYLYNAKFKSGTFTVNTSKNAESIIEILSKNPEAEGE